MSRNINLKSVFESQVMQYVAAVLLIGMTAILFRPLATPKGYHIVAFILLSEVSVMAVFLGIGPILLASTMSSIAWNYFFIPPHFALHIEKTEDKLMFISFFFIALINGVLTNRLRRQEALARQKEEQAMLLAESDKLYKTLFTLISHEFRIPISTIMGGSEALLDPHTSEKDRKVLFSEILKASQRLNHLIENLLNMSRLESGKISVHSDWVDMNDLFNEVSSTLGPSLTQHKIISTIPGDMPPVKLDFGLMEQVIYNLILNSCQYSPNGSAVIFNTEFSAGLLKIEVADEGPGFPTELLPMVFTKFFRVDTSRPGGLGLGLSIVKGIVEAHKGTVMVTNRTEGGALFTINIPTEIPDVENINNSQ